MYVKSNELTDNVTINKIDILFISNIDFIITKNMSISEISSQTTLLSMSDLELDSNTDFDYNRSSFSEKYRKKYKESEYIYKDWLKSTKSEFRIVKTEIKEKLLEIERHKKESIELYNSILESHELFKKSMGSISQMKKRKFSEVEE